MASLSSLYPRLISEKNFLIPCYNFVTVCDKGGFAEFIQKRYADINVSMNEVNGWAVFPRAEVKVSGVSVATEQQLNFGSLEKVLGQVRTASDSELGQSIMLLATDFSIKHPNPVHRERLMKLYFCYSLFSAFHLLCKDGNLVIKVYSTFQPATVELLYLLYRHFDTVSIVKPLASRASSPGKYIVCQGFDGSERDTEGVRHLCMVMERMHKMDKDMEHVLELTQVTKTEEFLTYILEENKKISSFQIARLKECLEYLSSDDKNTPNKQDVAERCLVEWGLKKVENIGDTETMRPTSVNKYSGGGMATPSQRVGKVGDYSQFNGILDRVAEQGPKFTPMTRYEKESLNHNDYLASLSNDKKDALQRSARLLEPKVKKPPKRSSMATDEPNPKKKPKPHAKKP